MSYSHVMDPIDSKEKISPREFHPYAWSQVDNKRALNSENDNGVPSPKRLVMEFSPQSTEDEDDSPVVIHINSGENLVVTGDSDPSIAEAAKQTMPFMESNGSRSGPITEDNIIRNNSEEYSDPANNNKRPRSVPSGRQKGLKKFKKDVERGCVRHDAPQRGGFDWPPPFVKTVCLMREWLINQTRKEDHWNFDQRQMLRTYYAKMYGLDSKKSGTGNIYLYFKVALLSKRCWELVKEIIEKIESKSVSFGKKKRTSQVYQTSFNCLTGLDPEKDESIIYEILSSYNNGEVATLDDIREKHGFRPMKLKSKQPSKSAPAEIEEDQQIKELKDKLEQKNGELVQINLVNKVLKNSNKKLLRELKSASEEKIRLLDQNCSLEEKIAKLEHEKQRLERTLESERKEKQSNCSDDNKKTSSHTRKSSSTEAKERNEQKKQNLQKLREKGRRKRDTHQN